jgi:hypothetical protein
MLQSVQDGSGEMEEDAEQEWEESEDDEFWTHFCRHMVYGGIEDVFEGSYRYIYKSGPGTSKYDEWMKDHG